MRRWFETLGTLWIVGCTADGTAANDDTPDGGTDGPTDVAETDDTDVPAGTDTPCPVWLPVDRPGLVWTYDSTDDDGTVRWTQEVLAPEGDLWGLRTVLDGSVTTLRYRCSDAGVELMSSVAEAGGITTELTFREPFLVWPAGPPTVGLTWVSNGTADAVVRGPITLTTTQTWSATWEIEQADVTYVTEAGDTWDDAVVYRHTQEYRTMGVRNSATEEIAIVSRGAPGLVWTDVVTTTYTPAPLVAESFTRLVSVTEP